MAAQHPGPVPTDVETAPGDRFAGRIAGFLLALFLALYLFTSLRVSAVRPFWMDEVLAAWVSRLPSAGDIERAIAHGAEFSPPTYHIFLHGLNKLTGGGLLAMRLPSLLAVLCCARIVFVLVRRRFAFEFAALACVLTLELALCGFAVQARPYALVTLCFALALVAWDRAGQEVGVWRACLIAAALSLAIALHFYAALLVGVLAGMEALRMLATRRLRARIWLALTVPVVSLAAWVPLMGQVLRYNAGDTSAPRYFAKPSFTALLSCYSDLVVGPNAALPITFALVMALGLLARHFAPVVWDRGAASGLRAARCDLDFDAMIACTVAVPLVVFAASIVVTRTFNERYTVAAALGVAMLYARLMARLPGGRWVACMLLAASCGSWAMHAREARIPRLDPDLAVLAHAVEDRPIVVGEGLHYLQLVETAPEVMRRRLVFLSMNGAQSVDPTDEHQVERWASLRPELAITELARFVATHTRFYLLSSAEPKDTVTAHFIKTGEIASVAASSTEDGKTSWLFTVQTSK